MFQEEALAGLPHSFWVACSEEAAEDLVVAAGREVAAAVLAVVALADLVVAAAAAEAPVAAGKNEGMKTYVIDVTRIEELQTLNDQHELENIFEKAKSTIVNGEAVVLVRKGSATPTEKFEKFTTLEDLQQYRERVFKYL